MFTWVSTHKAIARKLFEYKNRQPELIRLLKETGEEKLHDKDKKGQHIELKEIDPFSFFCFIYKVGPSKQIKRLQHIARHFNISPLPSDTFGLPSTNALKVMLFPFLEHRKNNEIDRLWNFFEAAMNEQINDSLFDDILRIEGAGRTKITETLFYIKPDKYLPINKQSKPYLKKILDINPDFKTFSDYKNIMQKAKEASGDPFYKISYDAWKWNTSEKSLNYWIFQANPAQYDLVSSLKEGALKTWNVTTHKDKITKGDKVILWLTGSKAGCYALCTVASKVKTRKDNKEELKYYTSPVNNTESLKAEIDIDVNLAENPVSKEQLTEKKEFHNFIKGMRGTNFKATKKQYEIISEMVDPKKNNIQYWLYAPGENAKMWDEFYIQGIMGIGWDELGDLNAYETKEDIRKKLQEIEGNKSKKTNDTNTNYDFKEKIKQNDIVIVKKGTEKYLGYGVIASDYYYDDTQSKYKKCRKVNWKKKGEWSKNNETIPLKTLTEITHQTEYVNKLKKLLGIREEDLSISPGIRGGSAAPLNQIFYGPPGTGKTYKTISTALEILGEENIEKLPREEVKKRFEEKVRAGRIVFTSFHQSMAYEDFVEGIKPVPSDKDDTPISYKVIPGIFTQICTSAAFSIAQKNKPEITNPLLDFSYAYDAFTETTEEKIAAGEEVVLTTKTGGKLIIDSISQQGNVIVKHKDGQRTYTVSKSRLSKLQKEIKNLDEITNINEKFRNIIGGSNSTAYWAVLNAIPDPFKGKRKASPKDHSTWDDKLKVFQDMASDDFKGPLTEPYVLIIDEINRGNIAQIFGELITLIEPDKRLGKTEFIRATLPYSQESFGVPPNLFIIGTMNTADRSVEALDTALRRRFSFEEMMPEYDIIAKEGAAKDRQGVVDGIDLSALLKTINERIAYLLDEDHQIGHSFFMAVKDKESLKAAFKESILPLLKEFFHNDYGKIRLILGEDFVKKIDSAISKPRFAADEDEDIIFDKAAYKIRKLDKDFDITGALKETMMLS